VITARISPRTGARDRLASTPIPIAFSGEAHDSRAIPGFLLGLLGMPLGHIYLSLTQHLTPPSRSSTYAVEPLGHVFLSILFTHRPLPTGALTPVPFFAGAFATGPGATTAGGVTPASDEAVGARVAGLAVCAIVPDE
jgi:hypothetical protein